MQSDNAYSKISTQLSNRISALKFMLIILIVYLHSYNLQGVNFTYGTYEISLPAWMQTVEFTISRIIASAAVPLFFMLSAVLLYRKPIKIVNNIKKKIKTVLIPFIIWNSVWMLVFFIGQSFPFFAPYFAGEERLISGFNITQWVTAYFPLDSSSVFCSPLWFLSDLFRLNLIAALIKKALDAAPVLSLSAIVSLWLFDVDLIIISTEALLFFMLGCAIVKYGLLVEKLNRPYWWADLLFAYALCIAAQLAFGGKYPILGKINIMLGIIILIKLAGVFCEKPKACAFLKRVSKYTFIIFVTHEYTQTIFKKLILIYLPRESWIHFCVYLLLPLFVVLLCVCFGAALRRVLPRTYSFICGAR